MTVSTEKKILLGFGAALLVMLFAGGAAWWNLRRFETTFLSVDHTHQVLNHLERAITGVLSMQTSTRGFVITGDDGMLKPYREGGTQVEASLAELQSLTADNPEQQARLTRIAPVARQAQAIMAARITARRERGLASASDLEAFLAGQTAVEEFRRLIAEMAAAERQLLHARLDSSQAAGRSTLTTIIVASTCATAFVMLAGAVVHRDFQRRRQAEEALGVLNAELEHRVAERTAQWEAANLALRREIASREIAQEAVTASELRLRTTLDSMLEGCQIVGPDWRYLYLNDTATVHGRSQREALLGRTMMECYPGIEQTPVFAAMRECRDRQTAVRVEQLFTYTDGTQAWFLLGMQPVPEGVVVLSLDITERKAHEERTRQENVRLEKRVLERTAQLEQANRELESFSYSVSHDLRAPLRHVDGFANMLSKHAGASLDDKGRRFLSTISSAARQMGRLIDDLLAFSRNGREPLNLTAVDQAALVAEVKANGGYEAGGRSVTWDIGPLPVVASDRALIRQVWANLIDNAVKYSGKNARPRIAISAHADIAKAEIIFTIADNGVGFDMAYADKLFGVFQRLHGATEFEGTGIGLANVRRIIIRHGGRVWAEGRPGEGATFFFTLPSPANTAPTAT